MAVFEDLDIEYDPIDAGGHRNASVMEDMARRYFKHLINLDGAHGGASRCVIRPNSEGRGLAVVFKVAFFADHDDSPLASRVIKMYQEVDQSVYKEEIRKLLICKEWLKNGLFAIDYTNLGQQSDGWFGIGYPDVEFEMRAPVCSLTQRLFDSDQTEPETASLRDNLPDAFKALSHMEVVSRKPWDNAFVDWRKSWLPHFEFNPSQIISQGSDRYFAVNGVSVDDDPTALTGPELRAAATGNPVSRKLMMRPMLVTSASKDRLTLHQNGVRVIINPTSELHESLPKVGERVGVMWTEMGDKSLSYRQFLLELIKRVPEESRKTLSALVPLPDDEIKSCLSHREYVQVGSHGDLHAGNILVNKDGILSKMMIIDVSDLTSGPRYADAARLEASLWYDLAPSLKFCTEKYEWAWRLLIDDGGQPEDPQLARFVELCQAIRGAAQRALNEWSRQEYLTTLSMIGPTLLKWAWRDRDCDGASHFATSALSLFRLSQNWLSDLSNQPVEALADEEELDEEDALTTGDDDDTAEAGPLETLGEASLHDATRNGTARKAEEPAPRPGVDPKWTVGDLWQTGLTYGLEKGDEEGRELIEFFEARHENLAGRMLLGLQQEIMIRPTDLFAPRSHVVISGPTSSGKTFVADLAMLKEGLVTRRFCVYVAPTRVLAQERHRKLCDYVPESERDQILLSTSEDVEDDPQLYRGEFAIACTVYEKANLLFTTGPFDMDKLGLLVVDEVHMMEDAHRGSVVELLIMKVLLARRRLRETQGLASSEEPDEQPRVLIISSERSVTQRAFPDWLRDGLDEVKEFHMERRPLPLRLQLLLPGAGGRPEMVHLTEYIFRKDLEIASAERARVKNDIKRMRTESGRKLHNVKYEKVRAQSQRESEKLIQSFLKKYLATDKNKGKRILVFGPSRTMLMRLANYAVNHIDAINNQDEDPPEEIQRAMQDAEPNESVNRQKKLARHGVYLHNANIDKKIRQAVETYFGGFREDNWIDLLFATSTLSYGVNLSLDCVVVASIRFPETNRFGTLGTKKLSSHELHNMLGRAGRYLKSKDGHGLGIIVSDLIGSDPDRDILRDYFPTPGADPLELKSMLMVAHDRKLAESGQALSEKKLYTNPFMRSVLDALRHMMHHPDPSEGGHSSSRPSVSVDEVADFLVGSYHNKSQAGPCEGERQMLVQSIQSSFDFCAGEDLKIISKTPPPKNAPDQPMRYYTNTLTDAIIDTGTGVTTLKPLLRWNRFINNLAQDDGEKFREAWRPELHFFGLILTREAWLLGREFAPEYSTSFPLNNAGVIELYRLRVKTIALEELTQLGVLEESANWILGEIIHHVEELASELDTPNPYDNAHIEMTLRMFAAACRWVAGRPVGDVEALSRVEISGEKLRGRPDRIQNLIQRMSWLAVAMYRCIIHSAASPRYIEQASSPDSLLRLSARLRAGCPSDALPLYNRRLSRLARHQASALIHDGVNIDAMLSDPPNKVISRIQETFRRINVSDDKGLCIQLLDDVIDFVLREDVNLAFNLERGEPEGMWRSTIKESWTGFNEAHHRLSKEMASSKESLIGEIMQLLQGALVGADKMSARYDDFDDYNDQHSRTNDSIQINLDQKTRCLTIQRPDESEQTRVSFGFLNADVEEIKISVKRNMRHLRITGETLCKSAESAAPAEATFLVGMPWFLPNALGMLRDKLGDQCRRRRWILLSAAGYFTLLTLLARGFLKWDDLIAKVRELDRDIHVFRVSDMASQFTLGQDLPTEIREAMQEYREVVLLRREKTGL